MKSKLLSILFLLPFYNIADESVHIETERPKADFLQSTLNTTMQKTASWLDSVGESETEGASAQGYLQLSWLPRTADLDAVDAKFKVHFNLPNWNNKLALVVNNQNQDELLLDYETNYSPVDKESINVAVQYIKQFNDRRQVKNRIGISRKQLYLRSEMLYNWKVKTFDIRIQPRIDYFFKDGWGPSVKGVINYPFKNNYFSLSATWQKIENESR